MIDPNQYSSIVILTGAGISAESGIKTFRDHGGLWEGHKIEDVATPEAFVRNPDMVHQFYNLRRQQLLSSATPNAAHIALAEFEKQFSGTFTLVTQNVDNLHEQAGSHELFHMHGELLKARCTQCEIILEWKKNLTVDARCPYCNTKSSLRPHIVWFGEMPLYMDLIERALLECDLFVSIGTSGQVYPAANFVQIASYAEATTIELNLEPCGTYSNFDHAHYGPATEIVKEFFIR